MRLVPATRREFALVLLAGAAGAGLVVLAVRQAWAHAIFTPPKPLPAQDISVTGQQLVPLCCPNPTGSSLNPEDCPSPCCLKQWLSFPPRQ